MSRLLRDRYYTYSADRAWDLATGEKVSIDEVPNRAGVQPLDTLVEVLDYGREGSPRWIALERSPGDRSDQIIRRAADDALSRGYIPIAVDLYLRLCDVLSESIQDRSLLLIARPGVSTDLARSALRHAAALTPRPHVLLTFEPSTAEATYAPPAGRPRAGSHVVREARAAYVTAIPGRASPPLDADVMRHVTRGTRAVDFVRTGRHAAAERLLRDVAGALVRRRASGAAAEALTSLGRLLLERGRARDADDAFGQAAGHAETAQDEPLAVAARLWQAAARTDAGLLTAAESLCRAALIAKGLSEGERARAEATLARVLLWQQRTEEARQLPMTAGGDAGDLARAYVGATAVRVLLEASHVFEAGTRARETLSAAESCTDPLVRIIALTAYFRFLVATGDLVLAEQRLTEVRQASYAARATFRLARVRLMWANALRRAGRQREAQNEAHYLERIRTAAPQLLRRAIDAHLKGESRQSRPVCVTVPTVSAACSTLVTLAQKESDDELALKHVLEFTARECRSSRLDLCSADAGPIAVVLSAGSGLPTRLGTRVLEAGIAIGPEASDPGREQGVPVRLGARLLAALVARWAADQMPPAYAPELLSVAAAVAASRVESLLSSSREVSAAAIAIPELVGSSAALGELRKTVARAAGAPFAVLIEGESGVGKELVARAIHHLSVRRQRRFCDVNCASLPDELIESELFGHARGAFTGAINERPGLFEEADGGTLFLDEVADLSGRAQAKLLRAIQQQEVRRVGESFSRKVDVRIVSAANRDMRHEAGEGRFRQDLLYRLEVIRIRIPPLRERPEDVAILASHFWRDAAPRVGTTAGLTHGVLTALTRYHWPGNVRELQNVMAALAVAAPARGQIRPTLLPAAITGASSITAARLADARAQFERRFIEVALARAGGSRSRAARELGISRQGLLKLLTRLGITGGAAEPER
jgi:two-component system response regulator HydG